MFFLGVHNCSALAAQAVAAACSGCRPNTHLQVHNFGTRFRGTGGPGGPQTLSQREDRYLIHNLAPFSSTRTGSDHLLSRHTYRLKPGEAICSRSCKKATGSGSKQNGEERLLAAVLALVRRLTRRAIGEGLNVQKLVCTVMRKGSCLSAHFARRNTYISTVQDNCSRHSTSTLCRHQSWDLQSFVSFEVADTTSSFH